MHVYHAIYPETGHFSWVPDLKWFIQAIGVEGIYRLTERMRSTRATARTIIGYAEADGAVHFFEGTLSGSIVAPRGANGFGWDALFQPDGQEKTFAEMTPAEKDQCSMRKNALERFQQYLEQEERRATYG